MEVNPSICFVLQSIRAKKSEDAVLPMALHDVFQALQIAREGAPAGGGQRDRSGWFVWVADFAEADQARLFESAQVRGKVAVGELQPVAQFCEGKRLIGGEDGHDGQARFGVNGRLKLVERRAIDGQ